MRKCIILAVLIVSFAIPVGALELSAPRVPEFAEEFMPEKPQNLAEGIRAVVIQALEHLRPDLKEASHVCISITAAVMMLTLLRTLPGRNEKIADLAGVLSISVLFLNASGSMVNLAADTVTQISEYGKLLLPVMTAAMAAQGGVTSSAAIYTATAIFDALLGSLVSRVLVPMLYLSGSMCGRKRNR